MNTASLHELSPCTLGGIEGHGWARYDESMFTNNLVGAIYFDPTKKGEVEWVFDADRTALYSASVYFGRDTELREATVDLFALREPRD